MTWINSSLKCIDILHDFFIYISEFKLFLKYCYIILLFTPTGPVTRFTSEIVKRWLGAGALDV